MSGAECSACKLVKLPSEFLDQALTPSCAHFRSACLRCTFDHAASSFKCITCETPVDESRIRYLKGSLSEFVVTPPKLSAMAGTDHILVTFLHGSRRLFPFTPDLTVRDLKLQIQEAMKIDANKFRLLFTRGGKELYVRQRGSNACLTLSHFGVCGGDILQLVQVISNFAGRVAAKGAKVDAFGNVIGSQYDYGLDGGCVGLQIAVLHLYTGQGFDFSLPTRSLTEKGFQVHRWTALPAYAEFEAVLDSSCQFWLISGCDQHIRPEYLSKIESFFKEGKGLFLWGDNDPYFVDANLVARRLLHSYMDGNLVGEQTVTFREGLHAKLSGFASHEITTGLRFLYEGSTIATIRPGRGVEPLIYGSANNLVTAYFDRDGCRCIMDGGFTRLYYNWNEAGQPRFVVNCAVWLCNMPALCGM